MSDSDKVFAGSIPEIYDTYLVPLIFEGFASDMAQRVAQDGPDHILETAAGSGVVTRTLAPTLKSLARYAITDLIQPMPDISYCFCCYPRAVLHNYLGQTLVEPDLSRRVAVVD